MARMNVYVPDEVAERAREAGLNVSSITQSAILAELEKRATQAWLDTLPEPRGDISHEQVLEALDAARDDVSERRGV